MLTFLASRIDALGGWRATLGTRLAELSRLLAEHRYAGRPSQPADADDALHNDAFFVRLRQLTTAQRTVVVLAYYEDLTLAAVAEQMDIPLGTVKSHLTRALDKMRTSAP